MVPPLSQCSCSAYAGGPGGGLFSFEQYYTSQPSHITRMTFYLRTMFQPPTKVIVG